MSRDSSPLRRTLTSTLNTQIPVLGSKWLLHFPASGERPGKSTSISFQDKPRSGRQQFCSPTTGYNLVTNSKGMSLVRQLYAPTKTWSTIIKGRKGKQIFSGQLTVSAITHFIYLDIFKVIL